MKGLFGWLLTVCMACLLSACGDPDAGPPLGDFPAIEKSITDAPFTIVAPSSRSPAAFTFTSSNTAVATIAGTTVTIRGPGVSTITASQPSIGSFGPTTKSTTLTVSTITCEAGNVLVNGVCTPIPTCISPATLVNNQCVASAPTYTAPNLIWLSVTSSETWTRARDFCTGTVINDVGGWRQPTSAELVALVGTGAVAGLNWSTGEAWSSTAVTGSASHEVVSLSTGTVASRADTASGFISCVRGG